MPLPHDDELRLHAGESNVAPLTTLIESARALGDHVSRLTEARREVDDALVYQLTPT